MSWPRNTFTHQIYADDVRVSGNIDVSGITTVLAGAVSVDNFPAIQDTQVLNTVQAEVNNVVATLTEVTNFPVTQPISGSVSVSNFPVTQAVSGTVSFSNTSIEVSNLPATQPVSGTVSVDNFPVTQPISGTVAFSNTSIEVSNFPATQPISGTVSIDNYPATQPISGTVGVNNFPVTQAVSGTVTFSNTSIDVSNFPVTQPISGAVDVNNFPLIQTVDGTVDIGSGAVTFTNTTIDIGNFPVTQPVSGTISVGNFPAVQPVSDNGSSLTVDGSVSVTNFPVTQAVSGTVTFSNTTIDVGNFPVSQAVTDGGGSITVDGSVAVSNFPLVQDIDGTVSVDNFPASQTVNGTIAFSNTSIDVSNFPAVQPVNDNGGSLTVDGTVAISSGSVTFTNTSIDVSNFPVTQPVSGTVAFSNTTIDVGNFPSVQPVNDNGGSLTVDGTVAISSGTVTFTNTTIDIGNFPVSGPISGTVSVSNFPAVQPVSDNGSSLTVDGTIAFSNTSIDVGNFPATQAVTLPTLTYDAFGRIRVSNPVTLFDSSFLSIKQDGRWAERIATGGSIAKATGSHVVLTSPSTAATGQTTRRMRRYVNYQPGKSLLVLMTGTLIVTNSANISTNNACRIGHFDDEDGFYFEYYQSGLSVVKRSSNTGVLVTTTVAQASFNLDPLDGTGPSGITLDVTKRNIFFIEWEWLGVGEVTMGIVTNRGIIAAHQWIHSNVTDQIAYTTRASLPVSYEIHKIGTGLFAASMNQICCSVISEGGYNTRGTIFSVSRTALTAAVAFAAFTPILSIRCTSARNKLSINPMKIEIMVTTAGVYFQYELIRYIAPTGAGPLTGAVWATATSTDNGVQYDETATAMDLTGVTYPFQIINSGFFSDATNVYADPTSEGQVFTGRDISGNVDWLVLCLKKVAGGGTEQAIASITYQLLE